MSPGCLPSVRSRSCDRAKPSAFPVTFARKSSHPCCPMRSSVSRQDPPPHRATPCNLGLPRGSPRWRGEDASLRPLQSTVDTSTREPFDFRARSLRCADRRKHPLPFPPESGEVGLFHATPDRLAAIRPRLGARLTARLQLRSIRARLCSPFGEGRSGQPPLWRCHLGLAFSAMREADVRPLTLPVAPRSLPESVNPGHFRGTRTASAAPSSKGDDFPDPKRLPSTGAPKSIRSRDPTGLEGARHRSRGLATDDPASDALSPLRRSRAEGLDPFIVVRKLFAFGREGPRAACRLLQSIRSASTTTDD